MAELSVTEAESEGSIEAHPGDVITLVLEEVPTSGFRWAVDELDPDLLEIESSEFTPAQGAGLGGGGTRRITLRVKAAGSAHVALKLWREWEGEPSVTRRFALTILAQP